MNISKMEKYTRQIIDGMYQYYGYDITDFSSIENLSIPWGLSKISDDGDKMAIVFISLQDELSNESFESDVCFSTNCNKERLVKVIFIDNSMNSETINGRLSYLGYMGLLQHNTIILDLENKRVQLSNDGLQPIANALMNVINSSIRTQDKKKTPIATYVIIGINILMFIISALLSANIMDINIGVLVALGAKYNAAIIQGQWFRLFTCMFLHGGLIHIATNMYSLYSIGTLVESLYGKYKYISIYIISGIISSLFSFLFSTYIAVGASGAIFGLLGVVFIFAAKERKRIGKEFFINIASVVFINLFIGLTLPNIDNFGHLGGFISGMIIGAVLNFKK